MHNAKLCRHMCGVQNGGSSITSDSTASQRSFATRKTPSHDDGRGGRPGSLNRSHNSSGRAGPSVNNVIRSPTVASDNAVRPATPSRSRQCSIRLCRPLSCVTSRTGRSS